MVCELVRCQVAICVNYRTRMLLFILFCWRRCSCLVLFQPWNYILLLLGQDDIWLVIYIGWNTFWWNLATQYESCFMIVIKVAHGRFLFCYCSFTWGRQLVMTGVDDDANYIRRSLLVYPSFGKMWITTRSVSAKAYIFLRSSNWGVHLCSVVNLFCAELSGQLSQKHDSIPK